MNRSRTYAILIAIIYITSLAMPGKAAAYWLWTPESKKFINPKYAAKDSPKEQFDWAMTFYDSKDFKRAGEEFEKLTKFFEYSEFAGRAQFYVGLCYENQGKPYPAYLAYQKAIENFPHLDNIDEIIEKQYNIGVAFLNKDTTKIMGTEIMSPADKAAEIFRKVVDNAPYGPLAATSQYSLGQALKQIESYEEAMQAFQKIIDNYPTSLYYDKAKYEVAYCAYLSSLKPQYAQEPTEKAIKAFQEFADSNQDSDLTMEAKQTVERLRYKGAEKSYGTAEFYERQKKYKSAILYYRDIIDRFPDSSFAPVAKVKIDELSIKAGAQAARQNKKRGWFTW